MVGESTESGHCAGSKEAMGNGESPVSMVSVRGGKEAMWRKDSKYPWCLCHYQEVLSDYINRGLKFCFNK